MDSIILRCTKDTYMCSLTKAMSSLSLLFNTSAISVRVLMRCSLRVLYATCHCSSFKSRIQASCSEKVHNMVSVYTHIQPSCKCW